VYVGAVLQGGSLKALVDWLCALSGVKGLMETPGGVRAYQRVGEDLRLLFLINFGEIQETVPLDAGWKDAFSGEAVSSALMKPADVRVLER